MKIAIMGFGTVGSGVKEVLELNRAQIEKKGGEKIEIKYILSRHEHIQGVPDELITTDFATIENDPEVELVVEAIGGIHPAYEYIKSCLEKGKHVVSSNKAVVSFKQTIYDGIHVDSISQCLANPDIRKRCSACFCTFGIRLLRGFRCIGRLFCLSCTLSTGCTTEQSSCCERSREEHAHELFLSHNLYPPFLLFALCSTNYLFCVR